MKKSFLYPLIVLFGLGLFEPIFAHTPPSTARVEITGVEDGATVSSPVKVGFDMTGFMVIPAGTKGAMRHQGGHHHLFIDTPLPDDMDEAIPVSHSIIHFNQGETEVELDLELGAHSLQLLLGDEDHEPQDPPLYSKAIMITVE
jgi:hypothetical protein